MNARVIVMSEAQWVELKETVRALADLASEQTTGYVQDIAISADADLRALFAAIDDENTRREYEAYANGAVAADQLPLFESEGGWL